MEETKTHRSTHPLDTTHSQRFDLSNPSDAVAFDLHLSTQGYAIVANAANAKQIQHSTNLFWDWLESTPNTTTLSRHDPSTWVSTKEHPWIPNPNNGLLSYVGQSDFCWSIRTLPVVKQAFQRIWKDSTSNNSEEMIVSFSGGCVFRPWRRNQTFLTQGEWWHLDQNGTIDGNTGKQCVQGLVSLTDATVHTGGLCVLPGSHHQFVDVCKRSPFEDGESDYMSIGRDDELLQPTASTPTVGKLICCKAGDLIVWDSRLVHCNTPASTDVVLQNLSEHPHTESEDRELIRLVGYVCMVPRNFATNAEIKQRIECYETKTQTSHWPHRHLRPIGFGTLDYDNCSAERKELIGRVSEGPNET